MNIALFLHLYQPPTQFPEVLEKITESSYRPILGLLEKYSRARVTINISASLTEQLVREGFDDVVADLTAASRRGQVELTGSAAYHPLLTEIPGDEVRRQIRLNDEINRRYFGDAYRPRGFFPPEMAINRRVAEVVDDFGFEWAILDSSALPAARNPKSQISNSKIKGTHLRVIFRNSDLSVKVAFSEIRTVGELEKAASNGLVVLAMDGETFGHHRPEQLQFLEELFSAAERDLELQTVSQVLTTLEAPAITSIQKSAWGPWERWINPENPIHQLQWELTRLAIGSVNQSRRKTPNLKSQIPMKSQFSNPNDKVLGKLKIGIWDFIGAWSLGFGISDRGGDKLAATQKQWCKARAMLDKSLHSDQYWWASANPFWHPEMVRRGAALLRDVVLTAPDSSKGDRQQAQKLYQKIIATGLKLHGPKIIDMS
jgi:peptidoglycan/xylan/chitin deacetylase (PgdA/CDA1 family)